MARELASPIGLVIVAVMALIATEPRLTLTFERVGDPNPQRFALTGEIMGKALGLVISWSDGGHQLLR